MRIGFDRPGVGYFRFLEAVEIAQHIAQVVVGESAGGAPRGPGPPGLVGGFRPRRLHHGPVRRPLRRDVGALRADLGAAHDHRAPRLPGDERVRRAVSRPLRRGRGARLLPAARGLPQHDGRDRPGPVAALAPGACRSARALGARARVLRPGRWSPVPEQARARVPRPSGRVPGPLRAAQRQVGPHRGELDRGPDPRDQQHPRLPLAPGLRRPRRARPPRRRGSRSGDRRGARASGRLSGDGRRAVRGHAHRRPDRPGHLRGSQLLDRHGGQLPPAPGDRRGRPAPGRRGHSPHPRRGVSPHPRRGAREPGGRPLARPARAGGRPRGGPRAPARPDAAARGRDAAARPAARGPVLAGDGQVLRRAAAARGEPRRAAGNAGSAGRRAAPRGRARRCPRPAAPAGRHAGRRDDRAALDAALRDRGGGRDRYGRRAQPLRRGGARVRDPGGRRASAWRPQRSPTARWSRSTATPASSAWSRGSRAGHSGIPEHGALGPRRARRAAGGGARHAAAPAELDDDRGRPAPTSRTTSAWACTRSAGR